MEEVFIDIEKEDDNKSCLKINEEEINKIELNPFENFTEIYEKKLEKKKKKILILKIY